MNETWKPIKEFETFYLISDLGRVFSLRTKTIRKTLLNGGYPEVKLCLGKKRIGKYIHRLLAEHFIPNPLNKPQVHHKDGNKSNNNLMNLEWVSQRDNLIHAIDTGLRNYLSSSKPIIQLSLNGDFIKEWSSTAEVSRICDITTHSISRCLSGRTKSSMGYKWVFKSKYYSS